MTTSWEFTATQLLRFDDRTARRNRPWPAGSMCRGASGGASVRHILWHGRNGLTSHIILLFGRVREIGRPCGMATVAKAADCRMSALRQRAAIRSETRVFSSLSDAVFKGRPLARCQMQSMLSSTIQHVGGVGRPFGLAQV